VLPAPSPDTADPAPPSSPPVLTASTAALGVLAVAAAVLGAVLAAPDAGGDTLWGIAMIGASGAATALAVLACAFGGRFEILGVLRRVVGYSFLVALAGAVAVSVTLLVPAVSDGVARAAGEDGEHYWFGEPGLFWLTLLAGWGLGLCAGLVALLATFVILAHRRPRASAREDQDDTAPEHAATRRRAGIAFAWLLVLVFAVPTLVVVGAENARGDDPWEALRNLPGLATDPVAVLGDLALVVGLLLIPVGLGLVRFVVRARRTVAGVPRYPGEDLGTGAPTRRR
jgi:hypothetical protein